jgi:hypothetical protein
MDLSLVVATLVASLKSAFEVGAKDLQLSLSLTDQQRMGMD